MSLALKKNDEVQVVAGKEKGKTGKVLRLLKEKNRVLVEKLNMIKKHTKRSQSNPQGGIIEKEAGIHISNLMVYCQKCAKGVRVGVKILKDNKKVRVCRQCEEVLDK